MCCAYSAYWRQISLNLDLWVPKAKLMINIWQTIYVDILRIFGIAPGWPRILTNICSKIVMKVSVYKDGLEMA